MWPGSLSRDTTSGVLHPALVFSAHEIHGPGRAGPKEGYKNNHRAGIPLQWRKSERVRIVESGEKKVPGRLYSGLLRLKGGL